MEFKFGKEPGSNAENQHEEQRQQDKGRQTTLLVLLLLLVGVVGYLYFFTGLIRPQEAPPKPLPPPQVVKQPLPPKDGAQPQPSAKPGTLPAAPVPAPAAAAKPATPPAATVPAPAAVKPVPSASAGTAKPVPVAPAVPAKPTVAPPAAKAAVKQPAPQAVKTPEPAKVAVPAPKAAVAPVVEKKATVVKQAPKKVPAVVKSSGPWTLVIGLYTVEGALAEDMVKLRKAGLTPVITMGPKRPVTMHRLQYGVFDDKAEAQKAVDMLKRQTGSGFSVPKGGKYEVFAGSYAVRSGAESEQQRLSTAGVKVTLQKTAVPIASRKLTAGTFTDRKAAEATLKKAKAAGAGSPVLE